jgi:hypothetical protein
MSCPLACPLAWRMRGLSGCRGTRFFARLPANDLLSVSPGQPVNAPRCAPTAVAYVSIRGRLRGEVVLCPLPRPFAWTTPSLPLRSALLPLPTKEKADRVRAGQAAGGGR